MIGLSIGPKDILILWASLFTFASLSCYYCIIHEYMGISIKYADGLTTNNIERSSICAFNYMFLISSLSFVGSCYTSFYWYVVSWSTLLHMKNGPQISITESNLLQFLLYHVLDFFNDYFQAFFFVVRGDNYCKPIV